MYTDFIIRVWGSKDREKAPSITTVIPKAKLCIQRKPLMNPSFWLTTTQNTNVKSSSTTNKFYLSFKNKTTHKLLCSCMSSSIRLKYLLLPYVVQLQNQWLITEMLSALRLLLQLGSRLLEVSHLLSRLKEYYEAEKYIDHAVSSLQMTLTFC